MKRIARVLMVALVLCLATLIVAACGGNGNKRVKVSLAGETENAAGEYTLTLTEGESKTYTIITGTLTDYIFHAVSSDPDKATAQVSQNTLSVSAEKAGSAVITLSETQNKAEDLKINVTVAADETPAVAPTGLNLSGLDESSDGDGSLEDPHIVKFSSDKTSRHTLNVQPSNASAEFLWTVGAKEGDTFVPAQESGLTAVQEGKTLSLSGDAGEYYVRSVSSVNADFAVYLKVEVSEYVALTGITTNSFALTEEEGYDYAFTTAKGTTWDIGGGMAKRGENLLAGNVFSGTAKPLNLTYYRNVYQAVFSPANEGATNTTWVISSDKENVFKMEADGRWTASAAGTATLTVTNTAKEATIRIKVEVEDTFYNGILKSKYDRIEAATRTEWDFDGVEEGSEANFDAVKAPLLGEWQLVMNKTTNSPDGDDGNQKIFYMGGESKRYGICLEGRIDGRTGLTAGTVTSLAWAKVALPAQVTSLTAVIGNNDKTFGSYRIVLVEENGTAHVISGSGEGWVAKATANHDGKPAVTYDVPVSLRGQTVAIVIEHALGQLDNNCELHIKGIWINGYTPVTGVTLAETAKTVGQSGSYQINATVAPANASYKSVSYAVTASPAGGDGKVTVSESGLVSIAADAPVGNYTVTVTSTDNGNAKAAFTLTVIEYVPVTSFAATLSLNGRQIAYGGDGALAGATIAATLGSIGSVSFTDPALALAYTFNNNASVTTVNVSFSQNGIVVVENGELKFVGVGTTTVTLTPEDNEGLAITFTVTVNALDEATSFVAGTKITKTVADMLGADTATAWKNGDGMRHFLYNTVDKSHSNAKYNYDGDVMQFENHIDRANSTDPVNVGYNKVSVPSDAQYLNFKVRGHNDDRLLEGANIRVRILSGANRAAATFLDWTTVANRWKQNEEWYHLSVNVAAYQGQEVILLFEFVGGLQNNGNYPAGSDSSAGGYLYLGDIDFTAAQRPNSFLVENGKVEEMRLYGNNLSADGWTVSATKDAGNYQNNVYAPLTLTYKGADKTALGLTTASFYHHSTAAKLAPWGVFPALDNAHPGTALVIESSDSDIFTVENGVLTPVKSGNAQLLVKAKAYADSTEKVTFTARIVIELVESNVTATEKSVSLEAGGEYTLKYTVSPAGTAVQYSVTAPAGGEGKLTVENGRVSVAEDALLGNYVVKIATADNADVYDEVTITVAKVTEWANKNAILDANTGWEVNGSIDMGVGEGVDLNRAGSYLSRTVDLTDKSTLTLGARTFVRPNETNGLLWVAVLVDGEPVRITANGEEGDTVLIDTTDSRFDSRNEYVYKLSAYAGQNVEIRIGIDQGTHVVITDVKLA